MTSCLSHPERNDHVDKNDNTQMRLSFYQLLQLVEAPSRTTEEVLAFMKLPLEGRRKDCLPFVRFDFHIYERFSFHVSIFQTRRLITLFRNIISSHCLDSKSRANWSKRKTEGRTLSPFSKESTLAIWENIQAIDALLKKHSLPSIPWDLYELDFWKRNYTTVYSSSLVNPHPVARLYM